MVSVESEKPLIFISHKHADHEIATRVASFIRDITWGNVDVFVSSNWTFDGPRFGAGLNSELTTALWNSDAVILIYTSADQDWSYCMWECGVATHPDSPDTRIIVFQCGHDVPTPFAADLRVDVRNDEHLRRFTKQLLTNPGFFPSWNKAIAPDAGREALEKAARDLFNVIKDVLPPAPDGQVDEWSAWPFLRIQLPYSEVEKLESLEGVSHDERLRLSHEVVTEHAVIVKNDDRAPQLFGLASFPAKFRFRELSRIWQERFPTVEPTWFSSCCEQLMVGARRRFPVIRRAPLQEAGGTAEYTPVLSRIKRLMFAGIVQFDVHFYNLSDPRAITAVSRMIPIKDAFHIHLGRRSPVDVKLKELRAEFKQRGLNRVPILEGEGRPFHVIHRSMIDQFLADFIDSDADIPLHDLTLAHVLAQPEMKQLFESSFAVVGRNASLTEAKAAMDTKADCRDVFVTENGRRDEPVLGWLTNVDIARATD